MTNVNPIGLPIRMIDEMAAPNLVTVIKEIQDKTDECFAARLQLVGDMFKDRYEFPLMHARQILAMCMSEELGGNTERKKFLRLAFDADSTTLLDHCILSGLWHWLKPWFEDGKWHANESAGALMRKVIRENMDGTWTDDSGAPANVTYD